MTAPAVVIIGEAMLELSGRSRLGGTMTLGQGGDTLNTAIYLARLGVSAAYVTALGQDRWSDEMLANWDAEGINTGLVVRHPRRMPGLYAIQTDERGERSFLYWRDNSAAREMFDLPGSETAIAAASKSGWLYFSGITLSILSAHARERLFGIVRAVRENGGQVAFDPNFRPRGWPGANAARHLFTALARDIDLVLPSLDDEDLLFGPATPQDHIARWQAAGVQTVVAKCGAEGCWIGEAGTAPRKLAARPAGQVVDTTGAGDSFNAGFLAARLRGAGLDEAVGAGQALARIVVGYPGAIAPAEALAGPRAQA
jgi:2-dehydro-3-deoxygluconokinase